MINFSPSLRFPTPDDVGAQDREFPIITICGSTRFAEQIHESDGILTHLGWMVLSVGISEFYKSHGHTEEDRVVEIPNPFEPENKSDSERVFVRNPYKEMLAALHRKKISMSKAVFVVNRCGYIGESTREEIEYAETLGLPIYYLEE